MGTKERQAIDIKLIELVKKNAVLYDERRYRGHHLAERTKIWDKIGAEMNQHFNVQRDVAEWKYRWRDLRAAFSSSLKDNNKRKKICDRLEFLRPYVQAYGQFKITAPTRKKGQRPLNTSANIERETGFVAYQSSSRHSSQTLSAHSDPADSSFAVDNFDTEFDFSRLNHETVAQNDSCYEIYYEDDPVADTTKDLPAPSVSGESYDADGDVAFGTLIVRELQKMEPNAKREFKRKVTQMLFT